MRMNNGIKIVVIIVLLLLGSIISSTDTFGQTIHEKTFSVSPGQQIELASDLGDVRIRTWNEDEVYVKITGNRKAAEKIDFDFEQTSDGIYIKADHEGNGWFSWFKGIELSFDIKIPEEFNAYIYTAGGDIDLFDLQGEAELKTSGGDVYASNCNGNFIFKTSGGDIETEEISGDLEMATSGGDIKTRKHAGTTEARTSGGDIKLDVAGGKIYASTSGGDVTLYYEGTSEGIELKTSGGDIKIYVSDDFRGDADLKTSGGDIKVKLPDTRTDLVSSSKFRGKINGGGALVECRTTGGDITIAGK